MTSLQFLSLRGLIVILALLSGMATATGAFAQAWLQIEAQPNEAAATDRARAYAAAFPDVAGFALTSGWYAIVLGPYLPSEAVLKLVGLRQERLIPGDSFVADGANFRQQFWPTAGTAMPDPAATPTPPAAILPPDETAAEARAAEAALDTTAREALQTALHWFGFYDGPIDGAFGPGTRNAMSAWQAANGFEATGLLTTSQRAALTGTHKSAVAALGLERVTETEAGIEIDLPLAMVTFDRYDPPFVTYAGKNGSGVTVTLISQPGSTRALAGLYDTLVNLDLVPLTAEPVRSESGFEITRGNDRIESFAHVELAGGLIKGFALTWPLADSARMERVRDAMKASFRPIGDRALDPGFALMDAAQKTGMLAGIDGQRPEVSRSGFFVDQTGTVLTTAEVLRACARLTIDGGEEMTLRASDPANGLALLSPRRRLAPPGVAAFQIAPERPGAEVAVAGYAYEDRLTAPSLTFGTVAGLTGLGGEPGVKQLRLPALAGDAGGPVLDATGAVIGMLLPRGGDPARQLPPDAAVAASAATVVAVLRAQGIDPALAPAEGALPPEDLSRRARAMTVIVSCWR